MAPTQKYFHGSKLPSGPYLKAYTKGNHPSVPIFNQLVKELVDIGKSNGGVIPTSKKAHFEYYNNNPYLWKIDSDKFLPFYRAALAMANTPKTARFSDKIFDMDDGSCLSEESTIEDPPPSPRPNPSSNTKPRSIIKNNTDALVTSLKNMGITQENFQAIMSANYTLCNERNAGWMFFSSAGGGRLSDNGEDLLDPMVGVKLVPSIADFNKYEFKLIPDTVGGSQCSKYEGECCV